MQRIVVDTMILECCDAAHAHVLITGDKDLLEIDADRLEQELPGLLIVRPK